MQLKAYMVSITICQHTLIKLNIYSLIINEITHLKEEYKTNPLIISVIFFSIFIIEIIGNTRMCHFTANLKTKKKRNFNIYWKLKSNFLLTTLIRENNDPIMDSNWISITMPVAKFGNAHGNWQPRFKRFIACFSWSNDFRQMSLCIEKTLYIVCILHTNRLPIIYRIDPLSV